MTDQATQKFLELFSEISKSTKSLYDLTSRMDERVKMLIEKQSDVDKKVDKISDWQDDLSQRTAILELRDDKDFQEEIKEMQKAIMSIERSLDKTIEKQEGQTNKFKMAVDIFTKVFIMVVGAWLVWKLGIK